MGGIEIKGQFMRMFAQLQNYTEQYAWEKLTINIFYKNMLVRNQGH